MSTVEKLLVQLWERKRSIIDLVKQQTESYSQHLACELIIDGITPPSWLLDPNTSGSKEPSKEDLISKILRPYPRPSVCGSVASYPGDTNLVINGDEEFSDGNYVENSTLNKDLNIKDDLKAPGFSGQDHAERVLNRLPEFNTSVASPKDQTDSRISNIYTASDQPLAGIQRSKSRQKALELRNSAKAPAKSGIRHEIISDVDSNQIKFSLSITNQPCQNDELSQLAEQEHCVIGSPSCEDTNVVEAHCLGRETVVNTHTKRITGSGSHAEVPVSVKGSSPLDCSLESYKENASCQDARVKRTESMPTLGSEHPDNLNEKSPKSAGPSTVCCQSFQDERREDADFLCKHKDLNVYTGGSTRSPMSNQRQSCGCDLMKPDRSSDDYQGTEITMMDSGDEPQDYVDASPVNVNHSINHNEGYDTLGLIIEDFGRHKEKDTSPSSSSVQHNACIDEISNVEVSSLSAKVHRGILALSSAGSKKQVDDSEERSGMGRPSVGLFRRLTTSKTRFYDKEKYHSTHDDELPNLEGGKLILDCEDTFAQELQTTSIGQSVPSSFGTHNMLQEGSEARESVLEDFGRHNEMGAFLSSSSIQHNANINEFSNLEEPSLSTEAHESIVVLSNARSARQVNHSEERLGLVKSSEGEFRRRTRSQTRSYHNETYLPEKVHVKHRSESSPVHCMEQGDCGDEGRDKGQFVAVFPERRNSRLSCSAGDEVEQSHGCSIKKSEKKYTARQPQMLSWPESEGLSKHGDPPIGNKSTTRPSTVRSQGDISSLTRIFTRTRTESWPQAKRRRIELQQAKSYTTSAGFQATKSHSLQRDPGNMYLKTLEVGVDTSPMEHVNIDMDDGICSEANTDQVEGNQSAILSQHGEVGSSFIETNERKSTSSVTNNNQLVGTISSLVMKESGNAERCFIEGTRTSPPSGDYLDRRTSADKQCRQPLRNLENASNNLNSENLNLSSTLHKETQQFPKWEDGLHVHHSALSSNNEDLQLTDVYQSIPVFEGGLRVHHSVISSSNDDLQVTDDADQSMPIFEGFTVSTPTDTTELDFAADGFDFGELELPKTTLERASVLVEICKSASLDSPSSHLASAFKFQETWNLCKSVPDEGHREQMEFGNIYPLNPDVGIHFQSCSSSLDDYKDSLDGTSYSAPLAHSRERYACSSRNQLSSPVGKLWDRLSSYTGSSVKCSSSNPELACFPIEEDPSSSEDNKFVEENAGDAQDETDSSLANYSNKRLPLEDLTNMGKSSAGEVIQKADSVDFLTSKLRVSETQEKPLLSPKYQTRKQSEIRAKQTSSIGAADGRKHQISSIGSNAIKKAKQSVNNSSRKSMRNKTSRTTVSNKFSLREQDKKHSFKESRRNNIVSNVSSFILLVQQKQVAAAGTGKRDVKVKALEDAEAAKRLQERKDNERKMRKEALKIERAKMEEKRKEGERKKKDADIIAKKRLREEELKEKEKKRMRIEARQRQKEQEEKKHVERPEKENRRTKDAQVNSKKEFNNEAKRQQSRETTKGEGVTLQKTENNLTFNEVVNYECGISGLSCKAGEVMDAVDKSPRKEDLLVQNSNERSYEISPYQCSDDEEDDDELPTKKYIPSWASKSSIALLLPLQQKLDPDVIFPTDRFCSMDAILLPRKLQQQQADT